MFVNYNNEPKLLGPIETIKISENLTIKKGLYEKRGNAFYDISIVLLDKEIFIGRFPKDFNDIKIKYKDGKILVYYDELNEEYEKKIIIKVFSLYDIIDDVFYSCTEEEALTKFDDNIDTSYLKNRNNYIYRSDIEKTKRLVRK